MQDVLIEVRASSPLVGVESLQVHAPLGARRFPLSQGSASALPEAPSRLLRCGSLWSELCVPGRIQVQHWTAPRSGRSPPRPQRFSTKDSDSVHIPRGQSSEILSALSLLPCDSRTQDFCLVSGLCVSHSATSLRRLQ